MTEQMMEREQVPIRANDPLWVYLDPNTKNLDPELKKFCEQVQRCSSPQQVAREMEDCATELASKYDLQDQDELALHEKLFEQFGQAGAHMLAKLNATDLLTTSLARSIIESAEEAGQWNCDTDRPADLFHLDACLLDGFTKGREQPFIGRVITTSDRLAEHVAEVRLAQEAKKARFDKIGVPLRNEDLDMAERLLALAGDKEAATSDNAVGLYEALKYSSPAVVERFLELAKKAHGQNVVDEWLQAAQDRKVEVLQMSLDAVKGNDRKILLILKAYGRYFRDKDSRDFVSANQGGVLKTLRIDGPEFDDWVIGLCMERLSQALSKSSIDNARAAARALASTGGEVREVFKRVATVDDVTYIDRCDTEWQAIAVSKDGWGVVKNPPVCFERSKDMHTLPVPEEGCSIFELERFLNIGNRLDLVCCVAWLVMAQRNDKACPLLAFIGPSGTAKSTSQTTLRRLVDPNKGDLRIAPKAHGDVVVAAANNWVVSYENISKLSGDVQDVLCSVVTGGAFSTRELYTTNSEHVAQFQRPIIINGITNFVTRPDLMQRTVAIEPPSISGAARRTDDDVRSEFNAMRPKLLGAVLDIHAKAMALLPEVEAGVKKNGWGLPRMASFALMGEAVARAMGLRAGDWFDNYTDRIAEQANDVLDGSPVFVPLLTFIREKREWAGTNEELRAEMRSYAGRDIDWFRTAKSFADALRRIEGEAKPYGISVYRSRSNGKLQLLVIYEAKLDKSRGVTTVRDPDAFSQSFEVDDLSDVRTSLKASARATKPGKPKRRNSKRPATTH